MDTVELEIDGRPVNVSPGTTVLKAALDAGIYIPHLCSHPDLGSVGACRLCIIEIDGWSGPFPTACTTPATDGMMVRTRTNRLDEIRRLALELILATHPHDCMECPKYLNCELQSLGQYLLGGNVSRFRRHIRPSPVDTNNPLFLRDPVKCVLCGRCVRACHELRGVDVLSFVERGSETHIGTAFGRSLADAGCRFCGACVEVCPTGALRDHPELLAGAKNRRAALVPCKHTCPAEIDVPRYVRLVSEGDFSGAAAVIREKVPLPRVLGYVCNHPCEAVCRRGCLNDPVSIKELKRFAVENAPGQRAIGHPRASPTGKRVAIVGSGPAGLTAAFWLSRLGHDVTVFEALPVPGGMMRVGIPEYRLPRHIVETEVQEIVASGVDLRTSTRIHSLDGLFEEGFDAILVAVGAHLASRLGIPGAELDGVLDGTSFLRQVNLGNSPVIGHDVLVLGGGNVAFDCARTALRQGARHVALACLESTDSMLATREEVAAGIREGIDIHNLHHCTRIIGENGRVAGAECMDVSCFSFDDGDELRVDCLDGSAHVLPAASVIFAVGQHPEIPEEFGLTTSQNGMVEIDPYALATSREGVFAAGDATAGTTSIVQAIASGRRAARMIDSHLGGLGVIDGEPSSLDESRGFLGRGEDFAGQRRCQSAPRSVEQSTDPLSVEPALTNAEASAESARCLRCDLRLKISPVKFWPDYASSDGA